MKSKEIEVDEEELKGCSDVARELGIGEAEVRAWARGDGGVPRVGPVFVFRQSDVDRLERDVIEEAEYEPNPEDEDLDEDEDEDEDLDGLDADEDLDDEDDDDLGE